jgi:hypothetical protein
MTLELEGGVLLAFLLRTASRAQAHSTLHCVDTCSSPYNPSILVNCFSRYLFFFLLSHFTYSLPPRRVLTLCLLLLLLSLFLHPSVFLPDRHGHGVQRLDGGLTSSPVLSLSAHPIRGGDGEMEGIPDTSALPHSCRRSRTQPAFLARIQFARVAARALGSKQKQGS